MAVSKKAGKSVAERALKKFQEKNVERESKARLPTTKTTPKFVGASKAVYSVTPAEIKKYGSARAVIDYKKSQGAVSGIDVEGKIVRSSHLTSEEARKLRTRFNVREEQIIKDIEGVEAAKPELIGGKVSWVVPGGLKSNYERALSIQKGKKAFTFAQMSGKRTTFYTPPESKVSETVTSKAKTKEDYLNKLPDLTSKLLHGDLPISKQKPDAFIQPPNLMPEAKRPGNGVGKAFGLGGESQEEFFGVTKTRSLVLGPYIAGAEVSYEPTEKTQYGTLKGVELLPAEQQKQLFMIGKTGKEAPMVSDAYTRQFEKLAGEYAAYPEGTEFLEFKADDKPEIFGEQISTAYKRKPVSKEAVLGKIGEAKREYQVKKITGLEELRDIEFKYQSKEAHYLKPGL